jgi:hypothetical protein
MKTKSLIDVNRFNKISNSDICDNICDISAFYFGADFPFNIGLYDNVFITCGLLCKL